VTLPAGTEIAVMTNQNINSSNANPGQTYSADIANNVTDGNGSVVIPKARRRIWYCAMSTPAA
jgi:hypothetical protein